MAPCVRVCVCVCGVGGGLNLLFENTDLLEENGEKLGRGANAVICAR